MAEGTAGRITNVLLLTIFRIDLGRVPTFMLSFPFVSSFHWHADILTLGKGIEVSKPAPILEDPAPVVAFKKMTKKVLLSRDSSTTLPRPRRPPQMSDFARLARHLCGKSIGLVLGGGGARGLSHVVRDLLSCPMPAPLMPTGNRA